MERIIFILLLAFLALASTDQKRFREDYVYDATTGAYYKLHIESVIYMQALAICKAEGTDLLIADTIQKIAQVHGMLKQFPDIGDYVWINDDGNIHESAEIVTVVDLQNYAPWPNFAMKTVVLSRAGEIETYSTKFTPLPFVCSVEAKKAPYDPHCDVYATGYEYKATVGSCYKIPNLVLSWNAAYAECKAEGAHLVVLNSAAEKDVVKSLMSNAPILHNSYSPYYYIAGIRANRPTDESPRVFRTIFNETLEEAGYSEWADSEPNNTNNSEYCGSLYESDGKYNDQNCAHEYGFICEKEKRAN